MKSKYYICNLAYKIYTNGDSLIYSFSQDIFISNHNVPGTVLGLGEIQQ